jgi:hypothetical protein
LILNNQQELFNSNGIILKWSEFKMSLDHKGDLSSRYKTFDGKTSNKVKTLDGNELFIYINISADTCMTRIANVMNKLFIEEDSIQIRLKEK